MGRYVGYLLEQPFPPSSPRLWEDPMCIGNQFSLSWVTA